MRLMVAVVVAATGLTALLTYLLPYSYTSSGVVLIERGTSPTFRTDPLRYELEGAEVMNSEIGIVKSKLVAQEVVDRLGLDTRPQKESAMKLRRERLRDFLSNVGLSVKMSRRDALINMISKQVKVKQVPNSGLLTIKFQSDDPEFAAQIVSAVMDVYIERHREIYSDKSANFFEQRVAETEERLRALRELIEKKTDAKQIEALELERTSLIETYHFYRDRLSRALADQAGDLSLVNVHVVDYPIVAKRPDFSRLFRILLAFLGSVIFSLAVALVWGYFDHTIYARADIETHVDVPVLGSIPRVSSTSRLP